MNTHVGGCRTRGPARLACLLALVVSAVVGACRSRSTGEPTHGTDGGVPAVDAAALPAEASPEKVVAPPATVPGASVAPPEDKVPAGADPWLAYADAPVTIVDAEGSRSPAVGDAVLPGSVVALESWGQAEIDLPDGSALDLDELTELFLRAVAVQGGLRQIELTVFEGNVRTVVAPSPESGSVFRVATPVGVVEAAQAEFAVEVDGVTGATRVLVFAGSVLVQSGEGRREVAGAGSAPTALEVPAPGVLQDVDVAAGWLSRWAVWDDRQADRLLDAYGIDLANPGEIGSTAFSAEVHPGWKTQLRLRRSRIERRSAALVESLGPEGPATPAGPREKLAAARDSYGANTGNADVSALEALRTGRAELWAARAGTRAERQAALRETMVQLRQAYLESPATP